MVCLEQPRAYSGAVGALTAMLIDAHQHFWMIGSEGFEWPTPDVATLYRDFTPDDLASIVAPLGVTGTVLVQAQPNDAGTDWLLELGAASSLVKAVVGWADMLATDAPARIAALARRPKMRGLRPMLQGMGDDNWIAKPALDPAIDAMVAHRLTLDALIYERHLPAIAALARRRPDLPIVIDHGAKPRIGARGGFDDWAAGIAAVATFPQICCKLSGWPTEATDTATDDDYQPFAHHLIACFGPERLMWGSDWPVVELRTSYANWLDEAVRLSGLDGAALDHLLQATAMRFYRLEDG